MSARPVFLSHLAWLRKFLENAEVLFLGLLLFGMLGLASTQVFLRLLGQGQAWMDVLVRHSVLWTAFFGAVLATSKGRHIRIDALGRLLMGWPARINRALLDLLTAWISWRLFQAAYEFVSFTKEFDDRLADLDWPLYTVQVVMPLGFALILLHALLDIPFALAGEGFEGDESRGFKDTASSEAKCKQPSPLDPATSEDSDS
jgi:TRAP-type C4-dicarboxylate transport system permease small subunit